MSIENLPTLGGGGGVVKLGGEGGGVHSYAEEEKTAFVEFINQQLTGDKDLSGVVPVNSNGDDIFKAVHDGILLSKMVNIAKEGAIDLRALNVNKAKLNPYRILENNNLCINSAKAIGCSVVNIGPQDISEGKPILVFSLMWQIIRIKLMSKINLKDHPELYRLLEPGETLEDFLKLPPEQILLRWFNYQLNRADPKHSRRVANFSGDVKDGENYVILLNTIAPKINNRDALKETDPTKRADKVLANAEKLGVKRFIKPSDIAKGNARLNLAFTAQIFNTWPALDPVEKPIEIEEDREERSFRNWLNNVGIDTYINNLYTDLTDGLALLQVIDKIEPGIVPWNKVNKPPIKNNYKKNENNDLAISLAKSLKASLVGIGGANLTNGDKQQTLSIVWQLRRKHLLTFLQKLSESSGKEYTEQSLLEDANSRVEAAGKSSRASSFQDPTLKNSRFLLDLIASIEPRAVDDEYFKTGESEEDLKENAQYAIAAARKIGASIFCLWEDIVEVKPKMILTFLGAVLAEGHASSL